MAAKKTRTRPSSDEAVGGMSLPLAKLHTVPQGVQTATDYRPLAEARLSTNPWQYLEQGSGNGITLRENLLAFEQAKLMTRPLVSMGTILIRNLAEKMPNLVSSMITLLFWHQSLINACFTLMASVRVRWVPMRNPDK